ncbi:MAG: sugar ABC transporter permease [Anaerolineales bacterium]|nr:sugar ABC transporter permease [Anaerolineales bacterium]
MRDFTVPGTATHGWVLLRGDYFLKRRRVVFLFVAPTVLFLAVFVLYPVLFNIWLSLTDAKLLQDTPSFVWLDNYRKLLSSAVFPRYLRNTVVWTAFSVVGQLLLGFGLALLINRTNMGFGTAFRSFLLIPYVVPVVALALVTKWLMNGDYGIVSTWLQNLGLIGHRQSPLALPGSAMAVLIIINVWRSYPFPMLIYWAALKGIDKELYEAASVDGAGRFQSLLHITLPHLKDTTLVLAVLRIVWTATYFDLIWMVTGGGPAGSTTHLPIMIYQASFGTFQTGYAASISVVLGILLFIAVAFYVRKSVAPED